MKLFVSLLCALLVGLSSADKSLTAFREWSGRHGKVYTASEHSRRFTIWRANAEVIDRLNKEGGAVFGHTLFSDLTREEYLSLANKQMQATHPRGRQALNIIPDTTTTSLDNRKMLPPVKYQGWCMSCWAFSAVGNMEAFSYKFGDQKVITLSEQQLVDCDTYHEKDCGGGWPARAMEYVIKAGGIAMNASYPYVDHQDVCRDKEVKLAVSFSNSEEFGEVDADQKIIDLVNKYGTVSVAVDMSTDAFQFYKFGVFDREDCFSIGLNHAMLIVGYGTDSASGKKYWLVRNSMTDGWGDHGYIRIVRGKNTCGINLSLASITEME